MEMILSQLVNHMIQLQETDIVEIDAKKFQNLQQQENINLATKVKGEICNEKEGYSYIQIELKPTSKSFQLKIIVRGKFISETAVDPKQFERFLYNTPRRTIDIAGLNNIQAGNMLECKVQPFRIDELTVKYSTYLKTKLENAGYSEINVGFVTAGSKDIVQFMILQQLNALNLPDPELIAYDMNDLCIFSNCA